MSRVLVIGDTHCPVLLDGYLDHLKKTRDKYKTTKTVHIGDLVDNTALSFHLRRPMQSPMAEYEKALKQVESFVEAFPSCQWLIGNHDALPYRWCEEVGVPDEFMKSPGKIWKTKRWKVHPRFADIEIDGCIYRHGDKSKGGRTAALTCAKLEFKSLVQGHHHSQGGVELFSNFSKTIFGLQTGCGVDALSSAMKYGIKYSQRPVIGCGVVIDGEQAIFEPMKCK